MFIGELRCSCGNFSCQCEVVEGEDLRAIPKEKLRCLNHQGSNVHIVGYQGVLINSYDSICAVMHSTDCFTCTCTRCKCSFNLVVISNKLYISQLHECYRNKRNKVSKSLVSYFPFILRRFIKQTQMDIASPVALVAKSFSEQKIVMDLMEQEFDDIEEDSCLKLDGIDDTLNSYCFAIFSSSLDNFIIT